MRFVRCFENIHVEATLNHPFPALVEARDARGVEELRQGDRQSLALGEGPDLPPGVVQELAARVCPARTAVHLGLHEGETRLTLGRRGSPAFDERASLEAAPPRVHT